MTTYCKSDTMARLICTIAIIATVLICVLTQKDRYEDKYDFVNVAEILANDKMREQYYKCFMELGPCVTADSKYFKTIISEVFLTQCKKCTDKQKEALDKVSDWYTKNQPEKWNQLVAKSLEDAKKRANNS